MKSGFMIDQEAENRDFEKYANFTFILDIWLSALEQNKNVTDYFKNHKYKNVCIYGMGLLGKHLLKQLKGTDIEVIFTIERNTVRFPDESTKELIFVKDIITVPDVIVVTPLAEYRHLKIDLGKIFATDIVSLEEIIMTL